MENFILITAAVSTAPKAEEKKILVNNGTKEADNCPTLVTVQNKVSPQKTEDTLAKVDAAGTKKVPTTPTKTAAASESSSPATTMTKAEQKLNSPVRAPKRKSRELKDLKSPSAEGGSKPKRNRVQTQPYQSPLPEIALIVKQTLNKTPANKNPDDKLIVFYKYVFYSFKL